MDQQQQQAEEGIDIVNEEQQQNPTESAHPHENEEQQKVDKMDEVVREEEEKEKDKEEQASPSTGPSNPKEQERNENGNDVDEARDEIEKKKDIDKKNSQEGEVESAAPEEDSEKEENEEDAAAVDSNEVPPSSANGDTVENDNAAADHQPKESNAQEKEEEATVALPDEKEIGKTDKSIAPEETAAAEKKLEKLKIAVDGSNEKTTEKNDGINNNSNNNDDSAKESPSQTPTSANPDMELSTSAAASTTTAALPSKISPKKQKRQPTNPSIIVAETSARLSKNTPPTTPTAAAAAAASVAPIFGSAASNAESSSTVVTPQNPTSKVADTGPSITPTNNTPSSLRKQALKRLNQQTRAPILSPLSSANSNAELAPTRHSKNSVSPLHPAKVVYVSDEGRRETLVDISSVDIAKYVIKYALRKFGIQDFWKKYSLFLRFRNQDRLIFYQQIPWLVIQQSNYSTVGEDAPYLILRNTFDISKIPLSASLGPRLAAASMHPIPPQSDVDGKDQDEDKRGDKKQKRKKGPSEKSSVASTSSKRSSRKQPQTSESLVKTKLPSEGDLYSLSRADKSKDSDSKGGENNNQSSSQQHTLKGSESKRQEVKNRQRSRTIATTSQSLKLILSNSGKEEKSIGKNAVAKPKFPQLDPTSGSATPVTAEIVEGLFRKGWVRVYLNLLGGSGYKTFILEHNDTVKNLFKQIFDKMQMKGEVSSYDLLYYDNGKICIAQLQESPLEICRRIYVVSREEPYFWLVHKNPDGTPGTIPNQNPAAGAVSQAKPGAVEEDSKQKWLPKIPFPKSRSHHDDQLYKAEEEVGTVTLEEEVKQSGFVIPELVLQCLNELEDRGLKEEGLYRTNGSLLQVRQLLTQYHNGETLSFAQTNSATICSLLKQYFRELQIPLFTFALYHEWIAAIQEKDEQTQFMRFQDLIESLPDAHIATLKALVNHLKRVAAHSESNKMTISNIQMVFGPTLFRAPELNLDLVDVKLQSEVVGYILRNSERLFGEGAYI